MAQCQNQRPMSFTLDGGLQLQVHVHKGYPVRIDLQVFNAPSSLFLHWGVLKSRNSRNWSIPSSWPDGSRKYKQDALQTPMRKSAHMSYLTLEITDSNVYAVEFLFKDEATNRWFKANGQNIHIELKWETIQSQKYSPSIDKEFSNVNINTKSAQIFNHVTHKKWDTSYLLNKHIGKDGENEHSFKPRRCSTMLAALDSHEASSGGYLQKNIFYLGEKMLAVLVNNKGNTIRVTLATDITEPIILHWGLSLNRTQEWLVPPLEVRPKSSWIADGACETRFEKGFAGDTNLQFLDICFGESKFIGIPFVIRASQHWIKYNGGDFYASLKAPQKSAYQNFDSKNIVKWLLDEIADREKDAERSLMHRFNIASDLTERAQHEGKLGLAGILVWMRFMSTRKLTWNKNYNVKPREISAAQDKFTNLLQLIYQRQPSNREMVRLIMSTVGRGGQGDVGQRIRDEILVIQQNNDCKGGMMEEWHQKLHNNTNPDDVVICQALLDYLNSNFNLAVYWKTLNQNGVTKGRLASYDRPINSEPSFRSDQKQGLIRDLAAYIRTLKAVHSGADLDSAIALCLGYDSQACNFMGRLQVQPVSGMSSDLKGLLRTVIDHVQDKDVGLLLEVLVESRLELRCLLQKSSERLKDLIFLDLALDSTVRTAVERGFEQFRDASILDVIFVILLVLKNLTLSSDDNEDLVCCVKDWEFFYLQCKTNISQWALYGKAVLDRTQLTLADRADNYQETLQPSAEYLGSILGVERSAIKIFTEEIIRAGSAASLSLLLNNFNPVLRNIANLGHWQIISPVEVCGFVTFVNELLTVQNRQYKRPTIIVANKVKGEEEIPEGVVGILTTDMPDVLSHVSVRARTCKVCFATCFDKNLFNEFRMNEGKAFILRPTPSELIFIKIDGTDVLGGSSNLVTVANKIPRISLKKRSFAGRYVVSANEFNSELVGSKSCNIAYLRQKVPSWIRVPVSVALPFGVFEEVLKTNMNKDVAAKIMFSSTQIGNEDFGKLKEIQKAVLELKAPVELVNELKRKMQSTGIPWPGDEGETRWQKAWVAIKKVWASKWNERAYISTQKLKVDHNDLSMAVLVQEIISADYAFVIHTTNPLSKNSSEIYAEVVKGLGETLVGAYPGRAMSFVANKSALQSPKITGYPSKKVGLFIKRSIIFRSDSNGEDLEGYAGAGLYDSVPMDPEEKRLIDYSSDKVIVDLNFQVSVLSKIAKAGKAIEEIFNAPQDIEGVIKDGEVYIVQARPQM